MCNICHLYANLCTLANLCNQASCISVTHMVVSLVLTQLPATKYPTLLCFK